MTVQPLARSTRSTRLSRRLLESIFSLQYLMFDRGRRNLLGLPCQKSPSVKTTTFACGKTKSGRPGNLKFRRHPDILCLRIIPTSFSSVAEFPELRILDMMRDRSRRLNMSGILRHRLFARGGLLLEYPRKLPVQKIHDFAFTKDV